MKLELCLIGALTAGACVGCHWGETIYVHEAEVPAAAWTVTQEPPCPAPAPPPAAAPPPAPSASSTASPPDW